MPPTFQFQFPVPLNQLVDQLSCQKSFGTLFKLGVKIYNYQSCLQKLTQLLITTLNKCKMKKGVRAMSLLGLPSLLHKGFCRLENHMCFFASQRFCSQGTENGFPVQNPTSRYHRQYIIRHGFSFLFFSLSFSRFHKQQRPSVKGKQTKLNQLNKETINKCRNLQFRF